jgi:hypothetical protein
LSSKEAFQVAARALGGADQGQIVSGSLLGRPATFKRRQPLTEQDRDFSVELSVGLAAPSPLLLTLHKRNALLDRVAGASSLKSVLLEDPEFEKTFLVEAAPTDITKALLTPERRQRMLKLPWAQVVITQSSLIIKVDPHYINQETTEALFALATSLLEGIATAKEDADRAAAQLPGADPYRESHLAKLEDKRREEIAQLTTARREAEARVGRLILWIGLGMFLLFIGVALAFILPSL